MLTLIFTTKYMDGWMDGRMDGWMDSRVTA